MEGNSFRPFQAAPRAPPPPPNPRCHAEAVGGWAEPGLAWSVSPLWACWRLFQQSGIPLATYIAYIRPRSTRFWRFLGFLPSVDRGTETALSVAR